jgi:PAS domain S-box-containing protein
MNKTAASLTMSSKSGSRWNTSISFRFLCIVSGILLVSSVVATGIICINQNTVLERFLKNKARDLGAYVAKLSSEAMLLNNTVQLDAIVREAIKDDDIVYAFIRDTKGQILTSQFASIDYISLQKKSIELALPPDAGILEIAEAIKTREEILEVSTPVDVGDQRIGTVTVGISEAHIDAQLRRTTLFVLALNIAAAFAAGAVLFAASRKMILSPIKELAKATGCLARGELDTRVQVKAHGEVKMLVEAFNQMAHDLKMSTVSKEYVDNIIGSMNETLIVVSSEGSVVRMNRAACRLLGYGEEELIDQPIDVIFPEEPAGKVSLLDYLRTHGNLAETEKTYRANDGRNIPVLFSASEIRTGASMLGYVCVAYDITKRKKAERMLLQAQAELLTNHEVLKSLYAQRSAQAEELEKAYAELKTTQAQMIQNEKLASIGQLAAGVAHEINNPIAFINSNLGTLGKYFARILSYLDIQNQAFASLENPEIEAELAQARKRLKLDRILEDTGRVVEESQDGVERITKIINGLKMFSRKDEEEQKEADINAGLESTISVIWNELKYKVTLNRVTGDIPKIKCYPGQLNQVFMNLLVNASHAIEDKGEITVATWQENGNVVVSIADTGSGMPESVMKHIFEPFFTTKEAGKGTGLGLSISYDIVKKHNGEITVESAPGKGTTFRVSLPVG